MAGACRCSRRSSRAASRAPSSSSSRTTPCRASSTRTTSPRWSTAGIWPESTRAISELRLTIEYESAVRLGPPVLGGQAVARHRRLSRRMAARPAAARQVLSRVLARGARAGRAARPRAICRGLARAWRPTTDPQRRRRRDDGAARWPSSSRSISGPASATTARCRRCRPAAS